MKNKQLKLLFISIFLSQSFWIYSQTIEDNLKKYWYYRDRLEEKYMIVGMPEKQGTNWPAERRFSSGIKWLGDGENPTHPFANNISVILNNNISNTNV